MKKEYHRRVSPIVRIGGLSRATHIAIMKLKNTRVPAINETRAGDLLSLQARTEPVIQSSADTAANQMK